jgi:hypothetical protein
VLLELLLLQLMLLELLLSGLLELVLVMVLLHASTWAAAGLGEALGGLGRRGGLGSLVVSLVGAWGACGGPGERRGDGVRVGSTEQLALREWCSVGQELIAPNRQVTERQQVLHSSVISSPCSHCPS